MKRKHSKIPKLVTAVTEELDISGDIYDKLTNKLNGPNTTIDGTEITYNAIAALASVPKFDTNKELYIAIKATPLETRKCHKLDYGCGTRCKNCFAIHNDGCTIPKHYNLRSRTPWKLRCFICHSRKTKEEYHLCGSIYCMFPFITITKPPIIKLRYNTTTDKLNACAEAIKIEWI